MAECKHLNFKADVKVARLADDDNNVTDYHADIEIHCADCMKPFQFVGVSQGFSFSKPTTNIELTELRAPIKPVDL